MNLHSLLKRHVPDLLGSRWEGAAFVTTCRICGEAMVKPPGQDWQMSEKR
ncbi:hypothetical protein [Sphingomonas crusticola]|nr:hypothetical protein [Sphingomonas crusticola]